MPGPGLASTHKILNKYEFWKAARRFLWNEDIFLVFSHTTSYSKMLWKVNFNIKTYHDILEEHVVTGLKGSLQMAISKPATSTAKEAPSLYHGKRLGHAAHPLPLLTLLIFVMKYWIFIHLYRYANSATNWQFKHIWSQENNNMIGIKVECQVCLEGLSTVVFRDRE